jgi:glycosyltransferase involved in cell wall biosynthesis
MFSVILPVYNGERWLAEAIQSVMNQTITNFECLIICNGCTDNSQQIATYLTAKDDRFKVVITNHANKSNALNIGICYSKYAWLAPIDADDIWMLNKLELQAKFINANPSVDILGTQLNYIGSIDCAAPRNPLTHLEIYKCFSRGKNPIPFPSSVYRKDVHIRGVGFYDTSNFVIEDYDFWQRCKANKMVMANLPDVLLQYRLHGDPRTSTVDNIVHEEGGIEKSEIKTISLTEARQQMAKMVTDSMYIDCEDEKMPIIWGMMRQIRQFDNQYRTGTGTSTPVNSVDDSKVGNNED